MRYMTIVLELLEDRPPLRDQLQQERRMLAAVEHYAQELKANHQHWQETLSQARPDSDPSQLASEAMELAISELEARLPSGSNDNETSAREEPTDPLKPRSSDG